MTLTSLVPRTPVGWTVAGLVTVGGGFALAAHWTHALSVAPYLFILACPLMHLFMHGNHGGHAGHQNQGDGAVPRLSSGTPSALEANHGDHAKEETQAS